MKSNKEDIKEGIRQAYKKLKESYMETVLCFALAAEYKDSDTGRHIIRISDYSVLIAQGLGLKKDEIEILTYASTMHDIGKIGIPDSILQKKASLSEEEIKIMRNHTVIGSRILKHSSSPILQAASEIALSHHERYDGMGYPRGLKADEIPLLGRIICLADSFDAMVSKRCYKKEDSFEEAIKKIRQGAGKQFDPILVHVFLKYQDKIKQILFANLAIDKFANNIT